MWMVYPLLAMPLHALIKKEDVEVMVRVLTDGEVKDYQDIAQEIEMDRLKGLSSQEMFLLIRVALKEMIDHITLNENTPPHIRGRLIQRVIKREAAKYSVVAL